MSTKDSILLTLSAKQTSRFWGRVSGDDPDQCWPWTRNTNTDGYGTVRFFIKVFMAHRVAWTLCHGLIPEGLFVLHSCDNPPCRNPWHLFLGTSMDNIHDCIQKNRRAATDENRWQLKRPEAIPRGVDSFPSKHPERMPRGETHGKAVLTTEKVLQIRALRAAGETQVAIAEQVGVARTTIRAVLHGITWRHVS
jgi:hypothetical protein